MNVVIQLIPCGSSSDRYKTNRILISLGDTHWITKPSGYNPLYFNHLYNTQIKYVGDLSCDYSKEYFRDLCEKYAEGVFIQAEDETHFMYLTTWHTNNSLEHHHVFPVFHMTQDELVEELL